MSDYENTLFAGSSPAMRTKVTFFPELRYGIVWKSGVQGPNTVR